MKRQLLFVVSAFCIFASGYAQSSLWSKVSEDKIRMYEKTERTSQPQKFELFSLDLAALKTKLQTAPLRDNSNGNSNVVISFPNPQGNLDSYRIFESPVMDAALAAKYPGIKSYIGKGIEDPTATINFTVTLFGLHTMTLSAKTGTSYIDTYTKDLNNYIVYSRDGLTTNRTFSCMIEDDHEQVSGKMIQDASLALASDGKYRVFRLAMACTIEYAAYHVNAAGLSTGTLAQKKAAVLAAMNVTMNRVNGLYERDMAMHMNLVANNDLIIFIDSDNFTNDNANTLINESQTVIDANIGLSNYDIGHTVSTGGGGLAQLNSPCTNNKARGITGSPAPVGDPYDIDYVAHEMGHQFGATHTFNGIGGNCTTSTRSNATAVEPGSGNTIMGYAGICPGVDVQNNSDAHFHAVSIAQMQTFVNGAGSCAVTTNNGNAAPVVNAGADYTIPYGTAFILKGSATDTAGESLTYCWEQTDTQISTQPPVATATTGPNFRSFPPSSNPNRYMPRFQDVLAGNLVPTWEVVPNAARTMNFALTVRDNKTPNGGQTNRDNMVVTFANTGPFRITSPSTADVSWTQGSSQTVTWDVAGTTANGINTANVNILLSTDDGATFTTLVANTPNDGSQVITVPNVASPKCRVMVEAVGNIFYALSKNIAIGYTISTTCNTYTANPNTTIAAQNPIAWQILGQVNVPDNVTISDLNLAVNISHTKINDLYIGLLKPGATTVGEIRIVYQQGCSALTTSNMVTTFDDAGVALACAGIGANNTYKPLNSLDVFNGQSSAGNWRLVIADVAAANNGTLNSFGVNICSRTETLGSESFGLQDFNIYPNPNNGNFKIEFNSNSNNDIKVVLHDIRGREIFNKSYQNSGLFNQDIQLNQVQSGIYIVSVLDGERKEVRKIVVE
ncbi:reprolysin-like metallopeptidase [Flavobacterium sp. UBA4197]|uniref:zinc-dependent metalloprotease n=1 Tax=Flavobacterium sp. UBA4197 TaxID=1946546 RepID=UPI00257BE623|nr:zinc-dependent metalloprotease family protein [Flavobacterium sp. UBA4197]